MWWEWGAVHNTAQYRCIHSAGAQGETSLDVNSAEISIVPLHTPPPCSLPWSQEHIEIVKPANFASGLGGEDKRTSLLAPIFGQIAKWFKR